MNGIFLQPSNLFCPKPLSQQMLMNLMTNCMTFIAMRFSVNNSNREINVLPVYQNQGVSGCGPQPIHRCVSKYVFKRIGIQRLSAKHALHFAAGLTSLLSSNLPFTHLYYSRGSEDIWIWDPNCVLNLLLYLQILCISASRSPYFSSVCFKNSLTRVMLNCRPLQSWAFTKYYQLLILNLRLPCEQTVHRSTSGFQALKLRFSLRMSSFPLWTLQTFAALVVLWFPRRTSSLNKNYIC